MKKVLLVILDGWGLSEETIGNAIRSAHTPVMDKLMAFYPTTALQASGLSVGLPWGKMGNSEVGHLTIGAGKVLYQNLPRVTIAIQNRSFFEKAALLKAIDHSKKNNSNIHLMGLVSNGGVHSHINHLYALLQLLQENAIPKEKVFIHVFTDGRDVDPKSGINFISELEDIIHKEDFPGRIATIMGRYYSMDRNENWDRTQKAYYCMTSGVGIEGSSAKEILERSYEAGITDEFIEPSVIRNQDGKISTVDPNDSVIFFNIREDRARQITKAFVIEEFTFFDRGKKIPNMTFATMMEYEKGLPVDVVFEPEEIHLPLGKIISNTGESQLRVAETEKYAHVTYFFNGGEETPFANEFRILIPSPNVDSYDKVPEMSAEEITKNVLNAMGENKYAFILVNYANPDMVGHTGNMPAIIKAVEFIDSCVGKLYDAIMENGTIMIITADHGNAEEKVNIQTGEIITEHSTNPVPFVLVDPNKQLSEPQSIRNISVGGMLYDIAPTVLDIMDLEEPKEMTGASLLESL